MNNDTKNNGTSTVGQWRLDSQLTSLAATRAFSFPPLIGSAKEKLHPKKKQIPTFSIRGVRRGRGRSLRDAEHRTAVSLLHLELTFFGLLPRRSFLSAPLRVAKEKLDQKKIHAPILWFVTRICASPSPTGGDAPLFLALFLLSRLRLAKENLH